METETFDDDATAEKPAPEPIKVVLRPDQREGEGYRVEPPILLEKLSGPSDKGESTMSLGWVSPKSRMAALIGGKAAKGQTDGNEKFEKPEDLGHQEPTISASLGSLEHAGITLEFEYPQGARSTLITRTRVVGAAAAVAAAVLGTAVYFGTRAEAGSPSSQDSVSVQR